MVQGSRFKVGTLYRLYSNSSCRIFHIGNTAYDDYDQTGTVVSTLCSTLDFLDGFKTADRPSRVNGHAYLKKHSSAIDRGRGGRSARSKSDQCLLSMFVLLARAQVRTRCAPPSVPFRCRISFGCRILAVASHGRSMYLLHLAHMPFRLVTACVHASGVFLACVHAWGAPRPRARPYFSGWPQRALPASPRLPQQGCSCSQSRLAEGQSAGALMHSSPVRLPRPASAASWHAASTQRVEARR